MINLLAKDRIKVMEVAELISNVLYPDNVVLLSDRFFHVTASGERVPLKSDPPYMMRFLAKPRIEQDIRNRFESGELKLICPITQGPVLKNYVDRTNPLDCLIAFEDFVNFARDYQICLTVIDGVKKTKDDERNQVAKKWIAEKKPDLSVMTNKEILLKLETFSYIKGLFITGGNDWLNRDHTVIPKRPAGRKRNK